ncbi:MAG TPA: flagellar hook-basal body complex protein FliE [bacterium]|jgi:flagellar hook-basal body complex protein FliE|nr:flagellar hook-basal body complex protein FliE [bacterium]HON73133.1 flagellar hook-basal body complex protein FliE [bacterium]
MNTIEPVRFTVDPIADIEEGSKSEESFLAVLGESIEKVNKLQLDAERMVTAFSAGEDIDIHNVMMAIERANLALSVVTEVRNRALEAYQEMMRMVP